MRYDGGDLEVTTGVREPGFRIAVDIGGTFTDAVAVSPSGAVIYSKTPSIPGEQDTSVLDGVTTMGLAPADAQEFTHGTTAGLNALLERRGARLALVTTAGFRDVYEIGRGGRQRMYDISYHRPPRLLRRRDVFELDERVGADGQVLQAPDEAAVRELAERLRGRYDAIAVCFLHAYRFPEHELLVQDLLRQRLPAVAVLTSHEIAPEWREYERLSTTVVSAYVTPTIADYLGRLESRLTGSGLRAPLHVMQSNGGLMTAAAGSRRAVHTLFSGPVGGTIACQEVGRQLGSDRLVCVDMGGTSFDVSLVIDGTADVETELEVEGHPLLAPSVSMYSVGSGGGSLISAQGGGLRVGPRSAGALPGPACYGRGGEQPTITDANLHLGRIPADTKLGGRLRLDAGAAERALVRVAGELGMDARSLARGAIAVADAMMGDAIREITVARGIDPREFDLLAFGGAGPLHAAALAEALTMSRVIVPAAPGVLSAWGMLHADVRHDLVQSCYASLRSLDPADLAAVLDGVSDQARRTLHAEGVPAESVQLQPAADLRYYGQEYTLTVPMAAAPTQESLAELADRFHAAYLDRYGHHNPGESVEMVNVRLVALGVRARPGTQLLAELPAPQPIGTTMADFSGVPVPTPVFDRSALGLGVELAGPAVILENGCTTLVPPGWAVRTTPPGHLILERAR